MELKWRAVIQVGNCCESMILYDLIYNWESECYLCFVVYCWFVFINLIYNVVMNEVVFVYIVFYLLSWDNSWNIIFVNIAQSNNTIKLKRIEIKDF